MEMAGLGGMAEGPLGAHQPRQDRVGVDQEARAAEGREAGGSVGFLHLNFGFSAFLGFS